MSTVAALQHRWLNLDGEVPPAAENPMVFLPLLLIWLRDPMYFNAPSRWGVVVLAVSIALLDVHRGPSATEDRPDQGITAALPEHRWLHTSHGWTSDTSIADVISGDASPPRILHRL